MSSDFWGGLALGALIMALLTWVARRCIDQGVKETQRALDDTITDGFGNIFPRWCSECGGEMQVVRPGKVQCPRCG